VEKKVPEYR
jgi:hypothetical protein